VSTDTVIETLLEPGVAQPVAALLRRPPDARALLVLAHGAGAGMTHPAMERIALGLAARGLASLRYQFPYMQRRSRRPDPPPVCHATVRTAVAAAAALAPDLPRFAGGRSFGGRMTSQAQALEPLRGVRGLVFIAFPLHPAGRPGEERAAHLAQVEIPLLFLSGTRDELAELARLRAVAEQLTARATLVLFEHADHALHVPARGPVTDEQIEARMLDALARWVLERAT